MESSASSGGFGVVGSIVYLAVIALMIASMWKIFAKSGEPGWVAIVPIYNVYVLFKIVYGQGIMFLLTLIPIVGFFVCLKLYYDLAKAFGKGIGYTLGLIFLPIVFLPLLGFGEAQYRVVLTRSVMEF